MNVLSLSCDLPALVASLHWHS